MPGTVVVEGLRELQRDLKKFDKDLGKELRKDLREVAEPVRLRAESLAQSEIRNIGPRWSRLRTGVTQKVVYIVPREKGRASRANPRLRRPNMVGLMLDRAMEPALHQLAPATEAHVETILDELVVGHGF